MNIHKQKIIQGFLRQKTFAIAGVSRNGGGYGYKVMQHLRQRGYDVVIVHPAVSEIDGLTCYPSLVEVPVAVDVLVLVVPPEQSEDLVRTASVLGIRRVWMQPGAESDDAIDYCDERCMEVIHDACLLVHA